MDFLIFIIAALGLTDIIVNQHIFEKPRNWIDKTFHWSMLNTLVHCEVCMGFWVGVGLSFMPEFNDIHWFIGGLCVSAANKIVGHILYKF